MIGSTLVWVIAWLVPTKAKHNRIDSASSRIDSASSVAEFAGIKLPRLGIVARRFDQPRLPRTNTQTIPIVDAQHQTVVNPLGPVAGHGITDRTLWAAPISYIAMAPGAATSMFAGGMPALSIDIVLPTITAPGLPS